jgi:hypothetical protein
MKIKYAIIAIVVLSLASCKEQSKEEFTSHIKNIHGELITVDCLIGQPYGLICYDTLLFLCDPYEGATLTVLDIKNNRFVKRILSIGNGPGEVTGSLRLSISPVRKELYVFQMQSGHINTYDLSGHIHEGELRLKESLRIEDRPANVVVTQTNFVGIGPFEDGRYHIYDKKGLFRKEAGKYPFHGEEMNAQARFFLYQGYLCAQPDGTHFTLGSSYSDNLEFYTVRMNQAELIKKYGVRDVQARFDNSVELDGNCLLGYKGAYAVDRFCYMLYSGKTYAENNHRRNGATRVFVFGWEGDFVKSYQFDEEIFAFSVDEKNETIYGVVNHEGETGIMRFKM